MDVLSINDLPHEMLQEIFSYLPVDDLVLRVNRVCTRWRDVVNDPLLWENIQFSCGQDIPLWKAGTIISNAPHLRHLVIAGRGVERGEIELLRAAYNSCKCIKTLTIQRTCLNEIDLIEEAAKWLPELRELYISSLHVITRIIPRRNVEVSSSDSDDCYLSPSPIYALRRRHSLKLTKLMLPCIINLASWVLKWIVDLCINLEELDIRSAFTIKNDDMRYLIEQRRKTLVSLKLSGFYLTDSFYMELETCQKLEVLLVKNCWGLRDASLPSIERCRLRCLSLIDAGVTSHGLWEFFNVGNFSRLITLNISQCDVDNYVAEAISQNCRFLQKLYLNMCHRITHRGVKIILDACKNISILGLGGIDTFNENIVDVLSSCGVSLRYVELDERLKVTLPDLELRIQDARQLDVNWMP